MADNRIAYGLAKKYGIDTTGMKPGEVWEALRDKGVPVSAQEMRDAVTNVNNHDHDKKEKVPSKSGYSKKLDSAVMNKYSSVRKQVQKTGFARVYVNDGNKGYLIKINKSDNDFDYDIIKEGEFNE